MSNGSKKLLGVAAAVLSALGGSALYLKQKYYPKPERPDWAKTRIACIGDSITFGAGVVKTRKRDAWPYVLERMLGNEYQVINCGFSGATLQQEGDLPYCRVGFIKQLKKAKPAVIFLMLGTNDSKPYNWNESRYRAQYDVLVKELIAGDWTHDLILLVPPKAFPEPSKGIVAYDIADGPIRTIIRPTVLAAGDAYGLNVVDLYSLTENHPEYFDDGVHPNIQGNHAIADALYRSIFIG